MDGTNQPENTGGQKSSGPRRRKRSTAERADHLKSIQEGLINARVKQILEADPDMAAIRKEMTQLNAEIHNARINVTKKRQKRKRLLAELEQVMINLEKAHTIEKDATEGLFQAKATYDIKELTARIRVRRELGLTEIDDPRPGSTGDAAT